MEKLDRFLYYFVLCCILLVLIVYAAVLFGGPGVVDVIVQVLLIFDFRKYLRARGYACPTKHQAACTI